MPSNVLRAAVVLALSLGCAACASDRQTAPMPFARDDFGEASRETLAAQIINPAPNYDGRTLEPVVLPSRFPNLLVNGSAGIAVAGGRFEAPMFSQRAAMKSNIIRPCVSGCIHFH